MRLFNGLSGFECILLVLGAVFFVTLLVMLILNRPRNATIPSRIGLFVVAVVMMAFPSIQSIKFSKDSVEIEKEAKEAAQQPASSPARQQVREELARLEQRRVPLRKRP